MINVLIRGNIFQLLYMMCVSAQSSPTLCDPMDYSLPGSSVHGISQAIAMSPSRGSSQPRGWTHVLCVSGIGRQIPYHCVPGKPL